MLPPATNFGEAWENLCLHLLRAETSDPSIMRLAPPDRGIDIFRSSTNMAYQCKSNERGIFGTINPQQCVQSLERAIDARSDIAWEQYFIALNGPLSGVGLSKIVNCAVSRGINGGAIQILPPEYWNSLCTRYESDIRHLFDYRVFTTEAQVVEAFQKARYYDKFVEEAAENMKNSPLEITVLNNRTPIELTLPFSGELTIEKLLDVAKELLGISLDWANFPDLGTSCGPSLSVTIDSVPQAFKLKLSQLSAEQLAKLQLWIKLVWRDELQKDRQHYDGTKLYHMNLETFSTKDVLPVTEQDRGRLTLSRMESIVQGNIWQTLVSDKGTATENAFVHRTCGACGNQLIANTDGQSFHCPECNTQNKGKA